MKVEKLVGHVSMIALIAFALLFAGNAFAQSPVCCEVDGIICCEGGPVIEEPFHYYACGYHDPDFDGVCGSEDVCEGNDATGDDDADGICNDRDLCFGHNPKGDFDYDGICEDNDLCIGDDVVGDSNGDGFCDDIALAPITLDRGAIRVEPGISSRDFFSFRGSADVSGVTSVIAGITDGTWDIRFQNIPQYRIFDRQIGTRGAKCRMRGDGFSQKCVFKNYSTKLRTILDASGQSLSFRVKGKRDLVGTTPDLSTTQRLALCHFASAQPVCITSTDTYVDGNRPNTYELDR